MTSPSDGRVAFSKRREGGRRIYTVEVDDAAVVAALDHVDRRMLSALLEEATTVTEVLALAVVVCAVERAARGGK